jgi:COMPASS component SWD3
VRELILSLNSDLIATISVQSREPVPITLSFKMSDTDSPARTPLEIPERPIKRRRVYDSEVSTPGYSSPDELGVNGDHKDSRRRSNHNLRRESNLHRRNASDGRSPSPDELDHTFYKDEDNRSDRSDRSLRRSSTPRSTRSSIEDETAAIPRSPTPPPPKPKPVRYKLKLVLEGHKRGVSQVKFSPDGRWIASCSADATIKVWDANTGKLMQTLEGHLAGISTIAWSPDSQTLASGSDDKAIRLWDRATGKPYPVPLLGHHNFVYSLAFSPKGNMLVSGSYDEAVFLWDVRAGRQMRSLPAHSDPVGGVDFVRDGTLVVSCATDGLMYV